MRKLLYRTSVYHPFLSYNLDLGGCYSLNRFYTCKISTSQEKEEKKERK